MIKTVLSGVLILFIAGCYGFFMDVQGLRAKVGGLELHFKYIKTSLEEIKTDVKHIKERR
jgi:hypothetical protein